MNCVLLALFFLFHNVFTWVAIALPFCGASRSSFFLEAKSDNVYFYSLHRRSATKHQNTAVANDRAETHKPVVSPFGQYVISNTCSPADASIAIRPSIYRTGYTCAPSSKIFHDASYGSVVNN